ncbi:hypothetical protein DMH12_04430 [Streptomyces sp. WAC 04229]|uniref:hypothetical protein n=1 Tax=Streptomyces sp. WAC 04229 TaxID=2203206 RepID=UPI000F746669|nr:hypothetical protein [Streptomyces sp. WAC 04229]RSN64025.1 hypothetical protein DMH12_04430 [Streptomyces sp. WAC 04229]
MKNDTLKWAALIAALVATASAEYDLARAVGFNQWVAAAVPGALDIYTIRALRAHRDVLAAVLALILVNSASHLVTVGLLPVDWPLVVAVAAIAPLVLWRVHRLADAPETDTVGDAPEYEQAPEPEPVPAAPEPVRPVPVAVPEGARMLPIVARPVPAGKALVPAAEYTRTRAEVHAEWTVPGDYAPAEEMPLTRYGLGLAAEQFKDELLAGDLPSIRTIKAQLSVGQNRAKEIQDGFRAALEAQASGVKL